MEDSFPAGKGRRIRWVSSFLQGRWSSISSSPFIAFNIEWKSGKIYVLLQNLIVLRKQIRLKNCCKCHSSYTSAQSGILCVINRGETTATEPNVSSDVQPGIVLWQALGERKSLKYFCRSLQLGDFAPKFLRDAELSWRGLILAKGMFPADGRAGASPAAPTIPFGFCIAQILRWHYQGDLHMCLKGFVLPIKMVKLALWWDLKSVGSWNQLVLLGLLDVYAQNTEILESVEPMSTCINTFLKNKPCESLLVFGIFTTRRFSC